MTYIHFVGKFYAHFCTVCELSEKGSRAAMAHGYRTIFLLIINEPFYMTVYKLR